MQVPSDVLQKLVCERCSGYLSRGPVHLLENTKYRCGRCPWTEGDEEEGIRVEAYEELAKLMFFPCRYQENGCTSQVLFTNNERHEQACPYREYLCPIAESGQCEWTGLQTGILEHCQQDHPTKVVENPCKFTYDITRPSLNNYILFVFEVLFLIQSKMCTATRKIYHAVRLIDDPARASDFKYTLDIENKHGRVTKYGNVAPRELLALQEDTSVVTGINSLLELLGDFKDTTFTVTIACSGQGTSSSNPQDHVTPPVNTLKVQVRCGECWTLTKPLYRGDWMCKKHAPEQRTCKNSTRGCTYTDISEKCVKHEVYCCQYSTVCSICYEDITGTTLDQHYTQVHGDITHRAGTVCTVSPADGYERLIIDCDFGRAVCGYDLFNSEFQLWVLAPIPSALLYKYRCTVALSHPDTGHTLTYTTAMRYSRGTDWTVYIPLSDYNAYVHNNKKLLVTILVITTPLVLSWNESREDDFKKIVTAVLEGHVEWYIAKDMERRLTKPDSQLSAQARVSDDAYSAVQNQFSYFNSQPQYNYQNLVLKDDAYQYPKPSIPFEAMIARSKAIIMASYLQQGYGGYFIPLKTPTTTPRPISPEQMSTMTNPQSGSASSFGTLKIPTAPTPISPEMTTMSSIPTTPDVPPSTSMTTTTPPQQGLAVLFLELMTPTMRSSVSGGAYFGNLRMPTTTQRPISRGPTTPRPIPPQLESIVDLIQMQIPGTPGAERPLYMVKGYFVPYLSNNS